MSKPNTADILTQIRRAAAPGAAIHPATRAVPPPQIAVPDTGEACIIIIGSLQDGVECVVGPFVRYEAAHEYAESGEHHAHDLSEVEWFIVSLSKPGVPDDDDEMITLPELEPDYLESDA